MKIQINKKLVPMKAHYFLIYSGLAPIAAFVPVIAKDLGFSALVVGTVYTIVPFLAFPIKIFLGGLADKYQCQKPMFLLLLLCQTLAYLSTYWIPSLPEASSSILCEKNLFEICSEKLKITDLPSDSIFCKINCSNERINFEINGNGSLKRDNCIYMPAVIGTALCNMTSSCKTTCEDPFLNDILSSSSVPDEEIVKYHQFWILLLSIAIARISGASLTSNADAITLNLLGEKTKDFGLQRLWGSAGWGLMSLISGFVIDILSEGSDSKIYTSAYYFLIVFGISDIIVSSTVDFKVVSDPSKSIIKDVFKAINDLHVVVYMLWCFVNGLFNAMVSSFLFWFLEEVAANNGYKDMTYIKTLEGLSLTFQCYFGEVPFFFISSWFIEKLGHVNSMTFVLGTYAVRFIFYSYLTNPWWTLPAEILHGITYGIFYTTMATYARTFSTEGTRTTVQNLVSALYDSLGFSMGNFIGGYLIQYFGGVMMFWYLGLCAASLTVLHAFVQCFIRKPKDSGSKTPEKKENESPPGA